MTTKTLSFQAAPKMLSEHLLERDESAFLLAACVLAKQHMIMVGAPGTAKSLLCRRVGQLVQGAAYFELMLSQLTKPDEVFGPVKLSALEQDVYERDTARYLPGAHIAFLDEVMRSSSAVLNSVLGVMSDRRYTNGHVVEKCPLWTVLGATNDLPTDTRYAALWDRFLVRQLVQPVASPTALLGAAEALRTHRVQTVFTAADVEQAQQEASALPLAQGLLSDYGNVLLELRKKGIPVSERRMAQSLAFLRACAWLDGQSEVTGSQLGYLEHVLWSLPEHVPHIQGALAALRDPHVVILLEAYDECTKAMAYVKEAGSLSGTDREYRLQQAVTLRKKIKSKLDLLTQANHPKAIELQSRFSDLRDAIEEAQ